MPYCTSKQIRASMKMDGINMTKEHAERVLPQYVTPYYWKLSLIRALNKILNEAKKMVFERSSFSTKGESMS